MTRLLQTFLDGLGNGSLYAGLALALVMVHRATHIPNFAQGELAMLGAYIGWDLQDRGLPWLVALLGSIILSFVLGFAIQRLIIRWVDDASQLTKLIVTLGINAIVLSLVGWRWGYVPLLSKTPFERPSVVIGGASMSFLFVGSLIVLAVTLFIVYAIFSRTKMGLGLRAAAMNPASARLVGVNVGMMLAIGWGLSLAIGSTAGVMAAPKLSLTPTMLSAVILYGFAAAVVGGFDSPPGAVMGAFLIAWLEAFSGTYWPAVGNELSLFVLLVVITVVLLVRPAGLFGKREVQRV